MYAELQVTTNFSFLRGASHPDEMMLQAAALGYPALAVTDRNSLAGVVRGHLAAKQVGIRPIIGARLDLCDGLSLLAYPMDRAAYGRLSRLISLGRRRAPKGECELYRRDVLEYGAGTIFIVLPPLTLPPFILPEARKRKCDRPKQQSPLPLDGGRGQGEGGEILQRDVMDLSVAFPGCVYIAGHHFCGGHDGRRLAAVAAWAAALQVPLVATNDAHMHTRARRPLLDVLTCIREKCTIDNAGLRLAANAERHLKSASDMARLFRGYEGALERTTEIVDRCQFSLDELRYEYPDEVAPDRRSPQEQLEQLTWAGARERYPGKLPDKVRETINHELALIKELAYAPYFLTVYDLVRFANEEDILCQGRGSAANSAVCYCLGITSIDPIRMDLLFERFVSAERNEPPDIDVDFEHERREEVIQYIYDKYGRERAGLAATVTSYRSRSAVREVGKVFGLSGDTITALASQIWGRSNDGVDDDQAREIGLDPADRRIQLTLELTRQLIGFPRHLSQHVGGFVITRGRLDELAPIENAAMEGRTVIEWDKDDLDALGILKIDVLSLGMLTCIRKALSLIQSRYGKSYTLDKIPDGDPAVYDMLGQADSVGVFQVESRAQMSFLPRMKPRNFYDLVIEVAIIRPGPIQGGMVHPYLRRRNGEEAVDYVSNDLRGVLEKTLGVPLFQEQAMKIAIVAAGFTPSEADGLRRAMATFRRMGTIHTFKQKMIEGMAARNYPRDFAERCFKQIEGFGEYGFPESHAASFALLVYASAWIKCHYPDVFACALLNSQPMGFYAPAQIVRDAREHGVEVRPPDVNHSDWDSTLELPDMPAPGNVADPQPGFALRLGLRQIRGLNEDDAEWLTAARGNGYGDPHAIWRRAGIGGALLERLARADALASMGLTRREALWAVKRYAGGQKAIAPLPLFDATGADELGEEETVSLPPMPLGAEVVEDYSTLRLSLKCHPMALLRSAFDGATSHAELTAVANEDRVAIAGLVLARQRPGTAKGVIFATLEDETGVANVIVWPKNFEKYRRIVLTARLLKVKGELQREGIVTHIIAHHLEDYSYLLDELSERSQFALTHGRGDAVTHPHNTPPALPRPRHPRDQARILFPSRDFH